MSRSLKPKFLLKLHQVFTLRNKNGHMIPKASFIAFLMIVVMMLPMFIVKQGALAQSPHGVITISFDDGYRDQFDVAYPMMKARGMVGTFYVITSFLRDFSHNDTRMSIDELRVLQSNGNEIGSHSVTHPRFSSISDKQVQDEGRVSKETLQSNGLVVNNFAYPGGFQTSNTDMILSQYYRTGRAAIGDIKDCLIKAPIKQWLIPAYTGETGTNQALPRLKAAVDQVYSSNSWTIFYFHSIQPTVTNPYVISKAEFEAFLDYIVSKQILTITVDQGLNLYTQPEPTQTPTPTSTPIPTPVPTQPPPSPTPTPSPTLIPTPIQTLIPTATPTPTPISTPVITSNPTPIPTPQITATPTLTPTLTQEPTPPSSTPEPPLIINPNNPIHTTPKPTINPTKIHPTPLPTQTTTPTSKPTTTPTIKITIASPTTMQPSPHAAVESSGLSIFSFLIVIGIFSIICFVATYRRIRN